MWLIALRWLRLATDCSLKSYIETKLKKENTLLPKRVAGSASSQQEMRIILGLQFLLLALYFVDSHTAVDGVFNDILHRDIESRSLENGAPAKNSSLLLGLVSITMVLGEEVLRKSLQYANLSLNPESNGAKHATTDKPPSWLDLFDGVTFSLTNQASQFLHNINRTCYGEDCFYENEKMRLPFGGPMSPEEVNTTFYFFQTPSRNGTDPIVSKIWTLENWTIKEMNDSEKPLVIVTHGFTGNVTTPWCLPLVNALLLNVNCNVIVADWEKGAEGPNYATAAANTPMAGVQISKLLMKIIRDTNCSLSPDNVTLIGFSLGAHVVGFAGRHFHKHTNMKLGRITGLDPAGMLFEGTAVALSRSDATFVDVIHTNMGDIRKLQLGLPGALGHVDFYPNGGAFQPGCPTYPKVNISVLLSASSPTEAFISVMESVACSHYAAPKMFIESLMNKNCNFTSYPCPAGWKDFDNCFKEFEKNATVKGLMGYYSNTRPGRGKQYLRTNYTYPFCLKENITNGETC